MTDMVKILVLGGTRFFGKRLVEKLLQEKHEVTIATRGVTADEFGNRIKRLIVNREDEEMPQELLDGEFYDVVYDNLCYNPNTAKIICNVLQKKVGKYIMTSSMAVYEPALSLKEDDFDSYQYPIVYGDRKDFSYEEGKRLAEAVLFTYATFPVIAVRFPVVIGENDYTKRLQFYVDHIVKQTPFGVEDIEGRMSFIHEKEAGDFLAWLSTIETEGPINACSNDTISMREVIEYIEEHTGIRAYIETKRDPIAPYNEILNCTLDNTKAKELGFRFNWVKTNINDVLQYYIEQLR